MEHVLFTREPPIGWVTLNHPQRRNALSLDVITSLDQETRNWAMDIGSASGMTLAMGKKAFYSQADMSENESYAHTQEVIAMNCLTHDAQEGMQAFLDKREPVWKDQ